MGMFSFNANKDGIGIDKNAPEKRRVFYFFERYFGSIWKLVQLNLLFVLFCLPIVTMGGATAAFMKVLRDIEEQKPIFLFSDFLDAFKENFKQATPAFFISLLLIIMLSGSLAFWISQVSLNILYMLPVALNIIALAILVFMQYYLYLIIVTINLPLKYIFKNSMILSVVAIGKNVKTTIILTILIAPFVLTYEVTWIVLAFLPPATYGFIICFNCFGVIKKYLIPSE